MVGLVGNYPEVFLQNDVCVIYFAPEGVEEVEGIDPHATLTIDTFLVLFWYQSQTELRASFLFCAALERSVVSLLT
jgi:hypothetical protein